MACAGEAVLRESACAAVPRIDRQKAVCYSCLSMLTPPAIAHFREHKPKDYDSLSKVGVTRRLCGHPYHYIFLDKFDTIRGFTQWRVLVMPYNVGSPGYCLPQEAQAQGL
jgi:hypothetical protein